MAATPEKKVKDKVKAILTKAEAYHFTPATHGFGMSGVPDIIGCYRGYFFAIECKAGDNKATQLQLKNLSSIEKQGGHALIVNEDNIAHVTRMLEEIDEAAQ